MKAVVIHGSEARMDHHRSVPQLRPDSVLVRPVAVALNPTDWRHIRNRRAKDGCILGCDYAGVVEAVGNAVTKRWQPGDRIFGCAHGANLMNPDDGVFAEHVSVIGDLQMRIPEGLNFEQAATVGLGCMTVGQGLYQKALKLDLPTAGNDTNANGNANGTTPVFIYGGSTATGALAIQYAKLSGYHVVTTCSPENFEYVKGLGADFVVDYRSADAGVKIRTYTDNALKYAWDTVSIMQSAAICADALTTESRLHPVYGTLLPVESPRKDVRTVSTVMHTVFGRDFKFGPVDMPASQEDFNFGKMFSGLTEQLLEQGRLRPHAHTINKGGLEGVIQGLRDLEMGNATARKLVYVLD